jgi:hypothetical protein
MRVSITLLPFFATLLFVICIIAIPHSANAHGTGLTFTATTTDYYVDVDYSDFFIVSGVSGRFDFKLFKDVDRTQPVDFTQVWVRIAKKSGETEDTLFDTIFSGWIAKALFGSTGMSITLHDAGSYNLIVRYNNGDNQIVEATLPFEVVSGASKSFAPSVDFWFGLIVGAFVLGSAFAGYRFVNRRRR